ncbi:stage II sporulation protein P [Lachnospiraceae bacterium]|nr:stage II sporulation protein P [Lachnospiraceae bacterium]
MDISKVFAQIKMGMGKALIRKKKRAGRYIQWILGGVSVLFVIVCYQSMAFTKNAPAMSQILNYLKEETAVSAWRNCMPVMLREEEGSQLTLEHFLQSKLEEFYPIYAFSGTLTEYSTQIESDLTCGMLEENKQESQKEQQEQEEEKEKEAKQHKKPEKKKQSEEKQEVAAKDSAAKTETGKAVEISREKLNDFDYLVQNFYQIDRTTTVDRSELNAQEMLAKDMTLKTGSDQVQILIYHTHSQEGYADSAPGDPNSSVVALGERLTQLLRDQYGFHVMHHMGQYDVKDRDNAYSYSGPALEQILAENPSIEVVIDLHRDGVPETTHLVSEVNGKQTAQIMFFNGLSRTTANGDIAYLANPNRADNLAFSFQMKLAAEEYYPGFARATYLKGYRYNLHYRAKSLLVEVGAQTNTLEEAMNAMEPLADILHKVLSP